MYDLAIIGGGPGGVAAGVYAARKKLKTVLITDTFGGQSIVSQEIQNWIGTVSIHGEELAKRFKEHLKAYADKFVDIKEHEL
ncbi:FAD-dependent oxidoreductase, partial [Candidatus Parcubacteria bacterium]|nr:FAD-dependent oxidoreductase [Candidatus Parcubacteria bacterium]